MLDSQYRLPAMLAVTNDQGENPPLGRFLILFLSFGFCAFNTRSILREIKESAIHSIIHMLSRHPTFVIGIGGGDGAGKSDVTEGLCRVFEKTWRVSILHQDSYYGDPGTLRVHDKQDAIAQAANETQVGIPINVHLVVHQISKSGVPQGEGAWYHNYGSRQDRNQYRACASQDYIVVFELEYLQ